MSRAGEDGSKNGMFLSWDRVPVLPTRSDRIIRSDFHLLPSLDIDHEVWRIDSTHLSHTRLYDLFIDQPHIPIHPSAIGIRYASFPIPAFLQFERAVTFFQDGGRGGRRVVFVLQADHSVECEGLNVK